MFWSITLNDSSVSSTGCRTMIKRHTNIPMMAMMNNNKTYQSSLISSRRFISIAQTMPVNMPEMIN